GLAFPKSGRIATRILGMRLCSHCGKDYEPPLVWAINTQDARIERCPNCGKVCKHPKSSSIVAR
ncbi:MAG TPA: hypothetical protein VHX44_06645, partial [Planctomycetota bacterium]|nr:hypothetical protein [Planctomycetota bacterium]